MCGVSSPHTAAANTAHSYSNNYSYFSADVCVRQGKWYWEVTLDFPASVTNARLGMCVGWMTRNYTISVRQLGLAWPWWFG